MTSGDSLSRLHDLSATKLLPDKVRFADYQYVSDLLKNKLKNDGSELEKFVIIDVRDVDYKGGHIANSVQIPDNQFYDQMPELMEKYHDSTIIVMCMDGSLRSIECIEYYAKARNQIVKYYEEDNKSSYYYQYRLKIEHSAHKTVLRSIKFDDEKWMKMFVEKKKINMKFKQNMQKFENLKKQKLFVFAGGFFEFINISRSKQHEILIKDFDISQWEELNIMGQKKIYHKIEYYTTRRSCPLRKTQTKRCF